MPDAPSPIPSDMPRLSPMLAVRNADAAIAFYKAAFEGQEVFRLATPTGAIAHAEVKVGDALIMLAEEDPQYNNAPPTLGGSSVILHLYVADVDQTVARAVAAGAEIAIPISDQFYGHRTARIVDPFGHIWIIASQIETVLPDEMQRRFDEMCKHQ